jgi:hypothetical protein
MKSMQLIDRYVYAVTGHLPEEIREDVGQELRSNIEDMLPEKATDEDIKKVLTEMGSPAKLAEEYNPRKRYLIGPGLYDNYVSVLKLVLGICAAVFAGIAIVEFAVFSPVAGSLNSDISSLITRAINGVIDGLLQGALWVTLVFVILERSGMDEGHRPFSNKKWSPDDLPDYPLYNKRKISRKEATFSMFWTILLTTVIYLKPELIAAYIKDGNGTTVIPLFNTERLQPYLVFILILAVVQSGLFIWKIIAGSWSIPMAVANAVYNGAFCILFGIMLNDRVLYQTGSIAKVTDSNLAAIITHWWSSGIYVCGAVILVICIWNSVSAFLKCRKTY